MGHCSDGELESCQMPFPVVPTLVTKTRQDSFSEPEDKWHNLCSWSWTDSPAFPQAGQPCLLCLLRAASQLSHITPASPPCCLGQVTAPSWATPTLGSRDKCKCLIKLLLNLFCSLLWAWRSSQQSPAWANAGAEVSSSTVVTGCC